MNKKKYIIFLFVIMLIAVVFFVKRPLRASNSSIPNDLATTIEQYYKHESLKQWEDTYEMRDYLFRSDVNFDLYKKIMDRDSRGWEFLQYEIIGVNEEKLKYTIKIKFLEKTPEGDSIAGKEVDSISIVEETVWVNVDGKWYSEQPGARTHLSLNNSFATSIKDPLVEKKRSE